jgi:antitoxin YefM
MKAVTYTDARKNLKALIQTVCQNSEPAVIVSSRSKDQAVLISLEDYQAMEETAYLLSSPANRAHLERSLGQAASGRLVTFPVEDL